MLLQSNALKSALMPYTLEGPFGRLLDAAEDSLALTDVQCFETETLMHEAGVVLPVLTYLFHRLEERFDGQAHACSFSTKPGSISTIRCSPPASANG